MVVLSLYCGIVMAPADKTLSEVRAGTHYIFSYNPARIKRIDTTNQCEQSATIIHRKPACDFYTKQFILKMRIGHGIGT